MRAQVEQARIGGIPPVNLGLTFSSFNSDYSLKRLEGLGAFVNVMPLHYGSFNIGLEGQLKDMDFNQTSHLHERSMGVGPTFSLHHTYFGLRPYARVMYGLGNFYYPYSSATRPSFYTDSFGIWILGGGAEYRIHDRLNVRVDYEYQDWTHFRGAKALTPDGISVGVSYRFF